MALTSDLISASEDQGSALAEHTPYAGIPEVNSERHKRMNPTELSLLNKALDWIQMMSIRDGQSLVYYQIRLEASHRELYVPPTTHLVATVDDLTDMPDYAFEEADNMDEDINVMTYTAPSPATPNTGK